MAKEGLEERRGEGKKDLEKKNGMVRRTMKNWKVLRVLMVEMMRCMMLEECR